MNKIFRESVGCINDDGDTQTEVYEFIHSHM